MPGFPRLNLIRRGSGDPLVLLHGIGGEVCVWEPVMEPLAREREVIALDLPGFGHSPALEGLDPTPAVLAQSVAATLDELGLSCVDVVGNSLGGWIALELARAGRARSVVGLCPAGLWATPLHPDAPVRRGVAHRVIRALGPVPRLALASPTVRRAVLGPFTAHPERIPYHAAWRMVDSYGRSTAYDATSAAMRRGAFQTPNDIEVPVTLAFGACDRLIRPVRINGYRSLVLPDCGHIPMWDAPELITRLILTATPHGLAPGTDLGVSAPARAH